MRKRSLLSTATIARLAFQVGRFLPLKGAPYLAAFWARIVLLVKPSVYRGARANLRHVLGDAATPRTLNHTLYRLFFNAGRRYYETFRNLGRGITRAEDFYPPVVIAPETQTYIRQALAATIGGFKSMFMAFVVLTLAWSLGQVCMDLETAGFLKSAIGSGLPVNLLPVAVFLVAAMVSFATGTSWGTMAILTPLAVPLILSGAPADAHHALLATTVSAILGGSVFGDHCSPISDTTIMSSMASGADHVDHVRTQLPYALTVGAAAVVLGYLPTAFGVNPAISITASIVALAAVVFVFGKKTDALTN